jgi:hypothetical protein
MVHHHQDGVIRTKRWKVYFFQIFTNLTKKGCVIKNYRQCLKMFRLENDITLLLIGYISLLKHEVLLRHEVRVMGQCIKFHLLVPKVICDNKP